MKKLLTLCLCAVLIVISTAAFAGDYAGMKIAYLPKTLNNEYYVALGDALEQAAAEYGIEVVRIAPSATTLYEEQINMVENVVQSGVNAIAIAPTDATALIDPCVAAMSAGIPVFNVDAPFTEEFWTARCGTDNYQGGYSAGEWLVELLGGRGKIAICDGYSGNAATTARYNGFKQAIADANAEIEILGEAYGNCEQGTAMTVCENFLTAYSQLDAIFCCNDTMALGASEAVLLAGREGIVIIGFDGNPTVVQKIIDGDITATIAQKPATMGRTMVKQFIEYMETGANDPRIIDTGTTVVTTENAETFLTWQ